jgi:hypothetical protein
MKTQSTNRQMGTLTGAKSPPASRHHCRVALALAAAWMLKQALALDVEVVGMRKRPAHSRGPAVTVAVQGDYAYVAAYTGGLIIIDIRDPANPQRVGGYDTSGAASGVAVVGNYAYVADEGAGLQVIDIRDPAHPQWVRGYHTGGIAFGVAVAGNYAYVADGAAGLAVVDLINLAKDSFHFLVTGEPGQIVRIQRSRNLRDWADWQQVTLGTEPADLTDTNMLCAPCGFYRAVAP